MNALVANSETDALSGAEACIPPETGMALSRHDVLSCAGRASLRLGRATVAVLRASPFGLSAAGSREHVDQRRGKGSGLATARRASISGGASSVGVPLWRVVLESLAAQARGERAANRHRKPRRPLHRYCATWPSCLCGRYRYFQRGPDHSRSCGLPEVMDDATGASPRALIQSG
jgi:hypothetical protein